MTWTRIIEGVYDFSRNLDWMFQIQEQPESAAVVHKCLNLWQPDGCIVDCGHGYGHLTTCFTHIPTVYLNLPITRSTARFFNVHEDTQLVCKAAFDHLLSLERDHYAFVTYVQRAKWADLRLKLFRERMTKEGKPHTILSPSEALDPRAIARLPPNCGILGCNDRMAQMVLQSAIMSKRSVPDDLAVMGIDNDTLVCEAQTPALTSIEIDLHSAGRKLGSFLAKIIDDPSACPQMDFYGPAGVRRRESTRVLRRPNAKIQTALEFIRTNACNGHLGIDDVAKVMGCARSRATVLFRQATGKSILDEINETRVQHAFKLLRDTSLPISDIVASCGYDSSTFFKKAFKNKTGMTMRDWRKQQLTAS